MSIAEDEAEKAYPTRYWVKRMSRNSFTATRTIYRKRTCAAATHHRLTPRSKPWRNGSTGTAAKGMTTNMWKRAKKKHGIAETASPDGRKTIISDKPRNYSHWRGRR
jgi:hypothetical protein